MRATSISGAAAPILLVLLVGCLEREERITVEADGAVDLSVAIRADSEEELYLGDAAPSEDAGWAVDAWIEQDDKGREVFRLRAEQRLESAVPLPDRYADAQDPYRDVVLRFPTSVVFEERPDGVYCHLARTYAARLWAPLEARLQQIRERIGSLDAERLRGLGEAERRLVVEQLGRSELTRLIHFARLAFDDITPAAPQDAWLAVREAPFPLLATLDHERLVRLLVEAEERPEAAKDLERERAELEQRVLEAIQAALVSTDRYPPSQINRFLDRFDQHRMAHEVTNDLGDERFTVHVTMPGTIVGHNGDERSGGTVTWSFTGAMLRDRDVELMVTSRLPS